MGCCCVTASQGPTGELAGYEAALASPPSPRPAGLCSPHATARNREERSSGAVASRILRPLTTPLLLPFLRSAAATTTLLQHEIVQRGDDDADDALAGDDARRDRDHEAVGLPLVDALEDPGQARAEDERQRGGERQEHPQAEPRGRGQPPL